MKKLTQLQKRVIDQVTATGNPMAKCVAQKQGAWNRTVKQLIADGFIALSTDAKRYEVL